MLITDVPLTATVLLLPVLIAIQFLFTLSIAYITAVACSVRHCPSGRCDCLCFSTSPVFTISPWCRHIADHFTHSIHWGTLLDGCRAIFLRGELPNVPLLTLPRVLVNGAAYFSHRFYAYELRLCRGTVDGRRHSRQPTRVQYRQFHPDRPHTFIETWQRDSDGCEPN